MVGGPRPISSLPGASRSASSVSVSSCGQLQAVRRLKASELVKGVYLWAQSVDELIPRIDLEEVAPDAVPHLLTYPRHVRALSWQ